MFFCHLVLILAARFSSISTFFKSLHVNCLNVSYVENFTIPLSYDTSLSNVKINLSKRYGKVIHINGEFSISTSGTWKTFGKIPLERRPTVKLYLPLFRFGETSKNVLYINNNGNIGVNSVETRDAFF